MYRKPVIHVKETCNTCIACTVSNVDYTPQYCFVIRPFHTFWIEINKLVYHLISLVNNMVKI